MGCWVSMRTENLDRQRAGLLVIDVQEALVACVDRAVEVVQTLCAAIQGCQILGLPIVVTEQYPKGLGPTTMAVQAAMGEDFPVPFVKTTFSCLADPRIKEAVLSMPVDQWILTGFEAHICVLQTAKDLLKEKKSVIVLNDAITSRSVFDFSTAIAELRDLGVRVTCTEAVLFELLGSSQAPEFKAISNLVK